MTTAILRNRSSNAFSTCIDSVHTSTNNGANGYVTIGRISQITHRALLYFDLSSVPAGNVATGAVLALSTYPVGGLLGSGVYKCVKLLRTGVTLAANWNTWDGTNAWGTAGAESAVTDYDATNVATVTITDVTHGLTFPDITALVNDAIANGNHHLYLLIYNNDESQPNDCVVTYTELAETQGGLVTDFPTLTITYGPAATSIGNVETSDSSGNLVPNDGSFNFYDYGDLVVVSAEFTNPGSSDIDTDPTLVNLSVLKPDGTVTTYVYGTDAQVVKDSTGKYHANLDAEQAGQWFYRWWSTGVCQAAREKYFEVRESVAQ